MVTILHGEDTVRSRQALDAFKNQDLKPEIVVLSGDRIAMTELLQAVESGSLFGQDRLVVLENFLSGRKKGKEQEEIIEYLKTGQFAVDLVLWEGKELGKQVLRSFPKAEIKIFKLDPHLFRFLETLKPGDHQKMLGAFRQALIREDVNLVFYMLIRQFRLLLFLKDAKTGLEEIDRLADWQKAKFERQAGWFATSKLLEIYHNLLDLDVREKTGLAAYPLSQTLELFLAKL